MNKTLMYWMSITLQVYESVT